MTTDSKPVNRRLAAIVVADVVGYTRLMERDEAGTHARLKEIREQVIDRRIREAGGRIISTAGDGMLVEFSSATAALRCAIEIQREMRARNLPLSPDERIELRMGINLGDIIVDGQDIAGDGVNVAARLEALAEAGGICISGTVREHARDDLDVGFIDIGEQQVKNIVRPIRVFRVSLEGHPSGIASDRDVNHPARPWVRRWGLVGGLVVLGGLAATLALRPSPTPTISTATTVGPTVPLARPEVRQLPAMSVAILPFTAAGATLSDQRLADALTKDLASELARTLRSAKVVVSTSTAGNMQLRRDCAKRRLCLGDGGGNTYISSRRMPNPVTWKKPRSRRSTC
jgi:class 3 adenylate cyclase